MLAIHTHFVGEDDASGSGTGTWRRHANKGADALSKLDQMMKTTKNAKAGLRAQRVARPGAGGERKWRSHAPQVSKVRERLKTFVRRLLG